MSTLTVFRFPTTAGAQQMEKTLLDLQQRQRIAVQDAVRVTWSLGQPQPKTEQLSSLVGQGALGGAFWGVLFGLIFFLPGFEPVAGGASGGRLDDYGIDDAFIQQVRAHVTEGTSALFVLTRGVVQDKVVAAMPGQSFAIIAMNLPQAKALEVSAALSAV